MTQTATDNPVDLDAYFRRIGYDGPRECTFEALLALHRCHGRAIPFENLDVLLGRGIRLDVPSIQKKLIVDKRGGYCFEQNALLGAVLRQLGFTIAPLIARVRWQIPDQTPTPLTHMILKVDTERGACLADVGFGSMSLGQPLRWTIGVEQGGSLEPRRLVDRGDLIAQQAYFADAWSDVYVFQTEPVPDVDFELANWFTSCHPQSKFTQNMILSRLAEGCRYSLLNREFVIRRADGSAEKRSIGSADELLEVLRVHFGLEFPPGTRFGANPDAPYPVQ